MSGGTAPEPRRLDDFGASPSAMSRRWAVFSDRVMGGVSVAHGAMTTVHGRRALQLTGTVSLERNGGFIQVACALGDPPGSGIDARAYRGLALTVRGTPGPYFVHLRTADTRAPWQYYAAPLPVSPEWTHVVIEWGAFRPASLGTPLNVSSVLRIGIVAATAAFHADIAVADLWCEP
jgi:hypothetical protein